GELVRLLDLPGAGEAVGELGRPGARRARELGEAEVLRVVARALHGLEETVGALGEIGRGLLRRARRRSVVGELLPDPRVGRARLLEAAFLAGRRGLLEERADPLARERRRLRELEHERALVALGRRDADELEAEPVAGLLGLERDGDGRPQARLIGALA